ncbi:MAG: Phosphoribosylformylglycinamidine synthase [Chloroflexota bacterium]|nr:Phosphoribosylformylglycinamidine synthase [Chloroflexota bacterium]
MSAKPPILILHATGTNRDREAAWACELAGGAPEIVHVNQLFAGARRLADYRMLVLPGGFSYGDDLGAGKLWAVALRYRLGDDLTAFIASGRPALGICNGFQVLVKAGLLPGGRNQESGITNHESRISEQGVDDCLTPDPWLLTPAFTLTRNDSARFECRWVYLAPQPDSPCVFTRGLTEPIYCPIAHGEGKFVARDAETLAALAGDSRAGLVALRYTGPDGAAAGYPWNPNGSQGDIAGICNPQGTVLGLMPHPENHLIAGQHPRYHRGERGMTGLPLFRNGVKYAAEL